MPRLFLKVFLSCLAVFLTLPSCLAQSIVVGRSLPLSGQLKAIGESKRDGGDAYIQYVNASGGIKGKKIELITLDDGYNPDTTLANMLKISLNNKPVAFLNLLRLPTDGSTIPVLDELKIPAVGISSGSDLLRKQFNKYGFPVRAGFVDEARKLVSHVKVIGIRKVSLVYQDVPLGLNIKALTENAFKDADLNSRSYKLDTAAKDIAQVVSQVVQEQPQAVFLGMLTPAAVNMVSALRQAAFNGAIYTFSSTDASVVAKLLGGNAVGLAISQVVPIPNGPRVKVVAEYLQALKALGKGAPGPLSLEAFIEAKILVEGLRRAGSSPTPASLINGLESLKDHDLGGFFIRYSSTAHTGSTFVEINVVNANGELIR